MSRKTGKNGKGFGKPKLEAQPDLEEARQAAVLIAAMFDANVELRKCNFCTDYYHVIPGRDEECCETCKHTDYELVSTFKPNSDESFPTI